VNALRAILLLVVYTAFSASTSFARHTCDELCSPQAVEHSSHTEAGLPPTECTEKEAVNNQYAEHRLGSAVKVAATVQRNTPRPETRPAEFFDSRQKFGREFTSVTVPLYISNCVYRL
jgi:hypothetical protein